jgi:DNA-binding transcriptional ArsR family regulator
VRRAERERPFYGQARPLALPPLPAAEAVADIVATLEREGLPVTDDVARVVGFAAGHPQRTMLLAHHLFDILASGESAVDPAQTALDRALDEVTDALRAGWDGLDRPERLVVVALAESRPATGSHVAREHGVARSTLQKALERLVEAEQHVVRRDGRPVLLDPLLGEWLRRR